MILDEENDKRCRRRLEPLRYDIERCNELATFACDHCGEPMCFVHTRFAAPPGTVELCTPCFNIREAQMVVAELRASSRRARRMRRCWPVGWLRWLTGAAE